MGTRQVRVTVFTAAPQLEMNEFIPKLEPGTQRGFTELMKRTTPYITSPLLSRREVGALLEVMQQKAMMQAMKGR
jgi:hypothetical protein